MPRGDLKAYTSITARIPQDLANEAKRYAGIHRLSVSELVRAGLEMRLEEGDVPGRTTGKPGEPGEEVLHEVLQVVTALSPMLQAAVRQTIAEVLHEVLPRKSIAHTPAPEGLTEVLPQNAAFDHEKFYLAPLCKRGHDYAGSGMSLLRKGNSNCVQCQRELRQARDAQRTAARQEGQHDADL
jgi:hypothetical protein